MDATKTMDASDVASGSMYLTVQNVFTNLVGIFGLTYLARAITHEQMGILTALTLISTFVQMVSDFGLTTSLPKFVSELKGRGEDSSAHILAVVIFKVPATLVPCLVLLVFSAETSSALFGAADKIDLVRLIALDSLIVAFPSALNSILLGAGRIKRMAVSGVCSVVIRWLVIVLLLVSGFGFIGTVVGWIVGDSVLLILLVAASVKLLKREEHLLRRSVSLIPNILKFSWPLFAAALVTFLYAWYDRAIILAFLPLTDLGIYDVCYKAFTVLITLSTALGTALYPYYGMAYGKKDHQAIASAIKRATRYTAIIVFPLAFGLLSLASPVITIFAGQQYESGWSVLAVLAVFGLVYGLLPAFTGLLVIYEKTRNFLLLSLVPVVASLGLLPLLWVVGLDGLAVMRGASLLVTLLLTVFFLSKVVKVEVDRQAVTKALVSSAIMGVVVFGAQQVRFSMTLFPVYVLMGAAVYIVCMRSLKVFDEQDIKLMERTFGKKATAFLAKIIGF